MAHSSNGFLDREDFQSLLDRLAANGYRCIAPTVADGAIVFGEIDRAGQLPAGFVDEQGPGNYSLREIESPRYFYWTTGPQAIKPQLFVSRESLWQVNKDADGGLRFVEQEKPQNRVAVIGVRSCDLAALAMHDQHFLQGDMVDPGYESRRQNILLIAVNCARSSSTCFCSSTGDGPEVTAGYDILLSELDEGFLTEAGSDAGALILDDLPLGQCTDEQLDRVRLELDEASLQQRQLPSRTMKDALFSRLQHPGWDDIARRCLSCGNCTSVCPTCFCHREYDQAAIDGSQTTHMREWDTCFSEGHSYIHGKILRQDTRSRYRQWMTHKLGSWHDQFGRSGCVGCGRCISWCPVGIDITVEASRICEDVDND
jgi:ferredoxin